MPPNKHWYCAMQMYTYFAAFLCSAYLLIVMTFERFYSIIRPHKAASFNTVKRARIIIICIFVFFFIYSTPFLFIGEHNGFSCVHNRMARTNILGEIYYWITEIVLYYIPFLCLLTMNSVIIHTVRKRAQDNLSRSVSGTDKIEGENLKSKNTEKQIIKTLLLVTFVFLILNIPIRSLVYYLTFFTGNDTANYFAGLHFFYQFGEKTYYANHGINFFLYVITGQKFRADLKNLFICKSTWYELRITVYLSCKYIACEHSLHSIIWHTWATFSRKKNHDSQ